jgi:hypothetical protein
MSWSGERQRRLGGGVGSSVTQARHELARVVICEQDGILVCLLFSLESDELGWVAGSGIHAVIWEKTMGNGYTGPAEARETPPSGVSSWRQNLGFTAVGEACQKLSLLFGFSFLLGPKSWARNSKRSGPKTFWEFKLNSHNILHLGTSDFSLYSYARCLGSIYFVL